MLYAQKFIITRVAQYMKKINIRKLVLALADILIIVVSGIVLNYVLSLTGVIGAEASRG